ncbi:MAG: hypothetical protein WC648_02505 [Candidatus Paceibacterota bacterium]|jgi:hypothetical protein
MKNRAKTSKQIKEQGADFLKNKPELAEAMRIFDVSSRQYKIATEATGYSTETSANPKSGVIQGSYFMS